MDVQLRDKSKACTTPYTASNGSSDYLSNRTKFVVNMFGARWLHRCCRILDMKNILVLNFLCLLINLFFVVMKLNKGLWPIESFFQPVLTSDNREELLTTLDVFARALTTANVTYFMSDGTLIGSYRHHGLIPWDDDIDVMINASEKVRVVSALAKLEPQYKLYTGGDITTPGQWKFYNKDSGVGFVHRPFRWPYIDMFFFRENATHVWKESDGFTYSCRFPKSAVFPLRLRPFESRRLPAPCDTRAMLAQLFRIELCRSRQFSHSTELPVFSFNIRDVPCERLAHVFPFVHHRRLPDGRTNESLVLGGWTLHSIVLPAACGSRI